jgi:hypothetical protein
VFGAPAALAASAPVFRHMLSGPPGPSGPQQGGWAAGGQSGGGGGDGGAARFSGASLLGFLESLAPAEPSQQPSSERALSEG